MMSKHLLNIIRIIDAFSDEERSAALEYLLLLSAEKKDGRV